MRTVAIMHELDSPTLLIMQSMLLWLMALLLLATRWHRHSEQRWALALLFHGLGNILLFLRPLMPHAWAILSYNQCVAIAFALSHYALSKLVKQSVPQWQMLLPVLISPLVMGFYLDDIAMRIISASLLGGIQVGLVTRMLARGQWAGSPALKHLLVISTGLFGAGLLIRGVWCWIDPYPFVQLLGKHPMQALLIILGILYGTLTSIVILLCHLDELNRDLLDQATHDSLTGALNRRAFMARAERDMGARHFPLSVLMLDLDHFKRINDRYGHAVGDQALISTTQQLRALLRETDSLGRIGGEEFSILLPHTHHAQALQIAERLRASIADIRLGAEQDIRISISIGMVTAQQPASIEQLLQQADAALYQAKSAGRNRVTSASGAEFHPAGAYVAEAVGATVE